MLKKINVKQLLVCLKNFVEYKNKKKQSVFDKL